MRNTKWLVVLGLGGLLAWAPAQAQVRPYIGYVYPAGGQQGTTFAIRLGGQSMDEVSAVLVSGKGVTAKVIEYRRRLNNQEQSLAAEQLRELKQAKKANAKDAKEAKQQQPTMQMDMMMMAAATVGGAASATALTPEDELIARLEKRVNDFNNTPACASIATILEVEVRIAPDAPPGEREIRVITTRGVSNPLAFHVAQVPEYTRKPMRTATLQVLGKEAQSLRKRPPEEAEDRVQIPCTLNGQIASGEMNLYRFTAHAGQRLVITSLARQLVPYVADAVPGWFQPVLVLYDAKGKEVAYDDDYRFKPDPVIFYDVPKSGDYVLAIYDAIFRGREDFGYRITISELPYITSIFPLGGRIGEAVSIAMKGWNLGGAELDLPPTNTPPGVIRLAARRGNLVSNRVPFMLDTLPECFEKENNGTISHAQQVTLPIIINGRIDKADDWDVFEFTGKSNETVVAEVMARRLDSPLDSVLKLTDANGKLIAYNDDCEDLASGVNTHHADSYFMAKLPADGRYFVHLGDTGRKGGEEYAYRLRISAPQPDFALRLMPSSTSFRGKNSNSINVFVLRKDGFTNTIKFALQNPPPGFSLPYAAKVSGTQLVTSVSIKADMLEVREVVNLVIEGRATVGDREIVHTAVPTEDRMQAFLWRHLLPAQSFPVLVYDPNYQLPTAHTPPERPPVVVTTNYIAGIMVTNVVAGVTNIVETVPQGKFTKSQVAGRIAELKRLSREGLIVDSFYNKHMDECEITVVNLPLSQSNAPPKAAAESPVKTPKKTATVKT